MTLQQMRLLCEIADRNCNMSEVGRKVHISQPAITRQVQLLERELGFDVLERRGKRIVGFTREGTAALSIARRMLAEASNLRQLSEDYARRASMQLTVATTHFHARYTLLGAILKFRKTHPDVSLSLQQIPPSEIVRRVMNEEADVGISAAPRKPLPELVAISYQSVSRSVIVPTGHPLVGCKRLTLSDLATYPLILYDRTFSAGWNVITAFEEHNLRPEVVLVASDADIVKTYVAAGLGVAVVQSQIYEPKRDKKLRAIDVSHLFKPIQTVVMLKPRLHMRRVVYDFIATVLPKLEMRTVESAVKAHLRSG